MPGRCSLKVLDKKQTQQSVAYLILSWAPCLRLLLIPLVIFRPQRQSKTHRIVNVLNSVCFGRERLQTVVNIEIPFTNSLSDAWRKAVLIIFCRFTKCDTVLCKIIANDYRRLSRFVLPIYRWYIVHFLDTLRTINRREIGAFLRNLVPTINRSNDTSFRRYIAKTIYRRACRTSSRCIASVKYRSSDLSLNQDWLIAIYRSNDISPQRVFLWREMLVYYVSFKRNNYKLFQIPPPLCFGIC